MINTLFRQVELSETYLSLLSVAGGDKSINNVLCGKEKKCFQKKKPPNFPLIFFDFLKFNYNSRNFAFIYSSSCESNLKMIFKPSV